MHQAVKRANFESLKILREKITAFIDYFNGTMAKPFKWTYDGETLQIYVVSNF